MPEKNKEQTEDMEFITEPVELEDEDLDDVAGGDCADGSGCCDGFSSPDEKQQL